MKLRKKVFSIVLATLTAMLMIGGCSATQPTDSGSTTSTAEQRKAEREKRRNERKEKKETETAETAEIPKKIATKAKQTPLRRLHTFIPKIKWMDTQQR